MKIAIYIDGSTSQLVLTPETDWEKQAVKSVETGQQTIVVMRGSFYETRGGWTRLGTEDESLILRTIPDAPFKSTETTAAGQLRSLYADWLSFCGNHSSSTRFLERFATILESIPNSEVLHTSENGDL